MTETEKNTLLRKDLGRALVLAQLIESTGKDYSYFVAKTYDFGQSELLDAFTYRAKKYELTLGGVTTSAALWATKHKFIDPLSITFHEQKGIYPKSNPLSKVTESATVPYLEVGFDTFMPPLDYMKKLRVNDKNSILLACYRTSLKLNEAYEHFESGRMQIIPLVYNKDDESFIEFHSPNITLEILNDDALEHIKHSLKNSKEKTRNIFPLNEIPTNLLPQKSSLVGNRRGKISGILGNSDLEIEI